MSQKAVTQLTSYIHFTDMNRYWIHNILPQLEDIYVCQVADTYSTKTYQTGICKYNKIIRQVDSCCKKECTTRQNEIIFICSMLL